MSSTKGNTNGETHGLHTIERRGREALNPAEVQSIGELRAMLDTPPGRIEVRKELTARIALIVARGVRYLEQDGIEHFQKGTGPLKYIAVYAGLLQRLLDKWPDPLDEAINVSIVLERAQESLAEVGDGQD